MLGALRVIFFVSVALQCIQGRPQGSLSEVNEIWQQIRGNLGADGNIELVDVIPARLVYETVLQGKAR